MLLFGLFLAEPASPLPERVGDLPISAAIVPRAGMLASIGFGAVFVVMVIFYRFRKFSIRVTEKVFGLVSAKLGARIAELVGRVSDGLRFLADARTAVPYTVITIGCLVAHVWGVQLLAYAVGLDEVTFAQAMVMVGMLALGFATPNAPGGFGAVQLALYAALAVYVAPARVVHQGGALVFLFHASYLALIVIIALLSLLAETRTAQSSMQPSAP
jgi:glycosyltransferase 2 family protein